jgi:methyl-accepting chemotaxis protein
MSIFRCSVPVIATLSALTTVMIVDCAPAQTPPRNAPAAPAPGKAAPPPNAAPSAQTDVDKLSDDLQKFVDERAAQLDAIQKTIDEGIRTELQANDIYARFVDSVRGIVERMGPQSNYRKSLEGLLGAARRNAEEYARSTNPKIRALAKQFTDNATRIEQLMSDASNEYARGLGIIRDLEDSKEEAIALIRAKTLKDATDAAAKYLDVVREVLKKAEDFSKKVKETAPGM